jgi:hypothetical protein
MARPRKSGADVMEPKIYVRMTAHELGQARAMAAAKGVSLPAVVRAGLRRWMSAESTRLLTPAPGRPFAR